MKTFARLTKLIAPYRWWVLAAVGLSFTAVGSSVGLMAISTYLISKAALATDPSELTIAIAGVRLFALSRALSRYLERVIGHTASFRILTHLRTWFYGAMEPLAPARLLQFRGGDLLSRITADIATLEQFYVRVIIPPISAALVTLATTLILGSFDISLGLALLFFLLVTGVILPVISRFFSRQPAEEIIQARSDLNASLVDGVQGIADLLAYGQEEVFQNQINDFGQKVNRLQERLALIRGLSKGLAILFSSLAGVTILSLAIPLVTRGHIDGVFLGLLPLTAIASFEAVQPLAQSLEFLDSGKAAAGRLFALIDVPSAIIEPTCDSPKLEVACLDFDHVSFRYEPQEPMVLDNLSFSVDQGQRLAIVGASGTGKTTIVNLLLRFWDYEEGLIHLGDNELRSFRAEDVRSKISVISQDTHIFNSTIRDNLHLANPTAQVEDLLKACRIAQLEEFINRLPLGLDTPTGENGLLLSGGERQRLAIARAILKNSPFLILDEATANLDAETERQLWLTLEEVMTDRTSLIVSHRTEVLPKVNKIIRL